MATHQSSDADINPLKLIGNARLALHHHMAPAKTDAESDSAVGGEEAPDVDPLKLVGNASPRALHHHMAPAADVSEEDDSRN